MSSKKKSKINSGLSVSVEDAELCPLTDSGKKKKNALSAYCVELSILPGGARRFDRFVLGSMEDLRYLVRREFSNSFSLDMLLMGGMDCIITLIQNGVKDEKVVYLQDLVRLEFKHGCVWFEDVVERGPQDSFDRTEELVFNEDGEIRCPLTGGNSNYTVCFSKDYLCPYCEEHTCECSCFGDAVWESELTPVQKVSFDESGIPALTSRGIAAGERIMLDGDLDSDNEWDSVVYGHADLEGCGDDRGDDWREFWGPDPNPDADALIGLK